MLGQHGPCSLAQTAFGAVALNRPADLLGGGEAQADVRRTVAALQPLDHYGTARLGNAFGGRQELGPPQQTLDL